MTDSGAITARGIKVSFGGRKVLDSLDLTLAQGDVVGLLGANGVGKTTLLKSLLGLQPLDAGRCTILGEPAVSLSPAARARIAYVPQTCGQFPWLTGQRMLRYVSAFYPVFDWDYARDLSARWRLALRTPVGALSPGQQQRLSIVRALSTRPDVLILDEPIASLDPATRIAVIDELIQERARRPLSIIFSSHLIGDLERLCSKLAIMVAGKIAVIEEMAWFRNLARVTLEGEESALADLSIPRAALVRNAAAKRRVVIADRDDVQRLATELPPSVRMTVDEPDVEVLASEWMQ